HNYQHSAPSYSQNAHWQPPETRRRRNHQNYKYRNKNPNRVVKPKQSKGPAEAKKTFQVSCWTFQRGIDPPRSYCSRQNWSSQRRVPIYTPLDKVASVFRGCTMSEMSKLSESAHLEPAEGSVYCEVCGGLVLVPEVHEASLLHQQYARPRFSKEPLDALVEDMLVNPEDEYEDDDDDDSE
ncbi:unnamed protein product, partial [Ixodes hexagonus]